MDTLEKIWPQWKVEGLIGKGSYGRVYKVKRSEMGMISYAALKVIELPQDQAEVRELANSGMDDRAIKFYYDDLMKKLQNEISVMEALKSGNNIVSIEDYAFWKKQMGWKLYIRMELLTNLDTYLASRGGELPVNEVIKLGMDICTALECCEQAQIIHRDIKPDNIFRSPYGDYKLGDFGIARQIEISRTRYSQRGTIKYMAPEVYFGKRYNKLVDIYSLGIMLYRLLNHGRLPFMPPPPRQIMASDAENAIQKRLMGEKLPTPSMAPGRLGKVILKACAYDAGDRYQSAGEVKEALQKCIKNSGDSTGIPDNDDRNYKKGVIWAAAGIAVFCVLLTGVGAFITKEKDVVWNEVEGEVDREVIWIWKLQPEIDADDICYVRSSDFREYSLNENQKQQMSSYAVIVKDGSQGIISMNGELKADIVYGGVYSDMYHEYTLSKLDENGSGEWKWYGLHKDNIISIMPGDTESSGFYYYCDNSLHHSGENTAPNEKVQEPKGMIPVQLTTDVLSEQAEWPASGDSPYAIYARGKLVTDFIYDECGSESDGLCAVKIDGKWGYVNDKGECIIPVEYDASWPKYLQLPGSMQGYKEYCYAFSEGYVPVCKDGEWELRDTNGDIVVPAGEFEEIRPVYEGCCWVKKNGKWGVIALEKAALENKATKE